MSYYMMPTHPDVASFLDEIAEDMVELFDISFAEAVARINAKWHGLDFSSDTDLILHEDPRYWSLILFYGHVPDWDQDADRGAWPQVPAPSRGSPYWTIA